MTSNWVENQRKRSIEQVEDADHGGQNLAVALFGPIKSISKMVQSNRSG
jgi:hypothetical protein